MTSDGIDLTRTLVEEDLACEEPAPSRAWLISIGSAEDDFASAGRIIPLEGTQTVTFGRGDEASMRLREDGDSRHVELPFGWVSGRHAELRSSPAMTGLQFELADLGSRNGTLLGGTRIKDVARLRSGDVFEIGRSFWMVREVRLKKARNKKLHELDPTGTCSPHLHHIERTLHRLARSTIPIVLRGETGTGKEHFARAIHRVSERSGPFIIANLSTLSEERLEAMLFGGDDGPGLFEQADRGTLMLDELADLSPVVQNKLLSALAEGRAPRMGEQHHRSFDVRIVACTMHDLTKQVESGRFRPDLYSRLAGFVAELPPLRARREDLGLLCRSFVQSTRARGRALRLTSTAFRRLLMRAWPFNIRQLHQTLSTAALLTSGEGTLTADALAEVLEQDDGLPHNPDEVRQTRAELIDLLTTYSGDIEQIASVMNRDEFQIHRWLERFALVPESYSRQ